MAFRWRRCLAGLGLAVLIVGSPGGTASAHTDFESSTPADGAIVESPLSEITIAFTNPAEEVGDGFRVFDGKGSVREPTSIEIVDGRQFILRFDPPLTPGEIGVRWEVSAGDAHRADGSFSFLLNAPPPTTAPPTAAPPTTAAPATTIASTPTTEVTAPAPQTSPPQTTAPPTTEPAQTDAADDQDDADSAGSLDEFLAGGGDGAGDGRQTIGRVLSLPAAVLAIGGLAFLATTLRGTGREMSLMLQGIGVAGLALVAGGLVELLGWLAASGESFGDAVTSSPGVAMTLRLVGGLTIVAGAFVAAGATGRTTPPAVSLSAAVVDAPPAEAASPARWQIATAPLLAAGVAIVVASFWFDGHTVSRGPRLLHAVVNSLHVVAAGVWAGGIVVFAAIAWLRHRSGEPSRATELIVRFSTIATIALVTVALAGIAMAAMIVDGPGDLTSTAWGKTLLLKTGAVGLAALMGAYNHFRLRPALEASPDDDELAHELRLTLIGEAVVLTFVVVVTAWLVAAAV